MSGSGNFIFLVPYVCSATVLPPLPVCSSLSWPSFPSELHSPRGRIWHRCGRESFRATGARFTRRRFLCLHACSQVRTLPNSAVNPPDEPTASGCRRHASCDKCTAHRIELFRVRCARISVPLHGRGVGVDPQSVIGIGLFYFIAGRLCCVLVRTNIRIKSEKRSVPGKNRG